MDALIFSDKSGIALRLGRFWSILGRCGLAGSLAQKALSRTGIMASHSSGIRFMLHRLSEIFLAILRPREALAAILLLLVAMRSFASPAEEDLWTGARNGDEKAVAALLAKGVDVNARTPYGATALWFAAYKNHPGVVTLLLKAKADVEVRDRVWGETPLSLAVDAGGVDTAAALLKAGASGADSSLIAAAAAGKSAIVQILLDRGKVSPEAKAAALAATAKDAAAVSDLLRKAGAKPLAPIASMPAPGDLAALAGDYESREGHSVKLSIKDGLLVTISRFGVVVLKPVAADSFSAIAGRGATLTLQR
jgi:ankyrin repeat protein